MKEEDIAFVDWIDICEILFIYLFSFLLFFRVTIIIYQVTLHDL